MRLISQSFVSASYTESGFPLEQFSSLVPPIKKPPHNCEMAALFIDKYERSAFPAQVYGRSALLGRLLN